MENHEDTLFSEDSGAVWEPPACPAVLPNRLYVILTNRKWSWGLWWRRTEGDGPLYTAMEKPVSQNSHTAHMWCTHMHADTRTQQNKNE